MTTARVRDFTRINPLKFYDSKVEEDPQEFIDEVYKILAIKGVTLVEKAKFTACQLKRVAKIWFNQWKETRPIEADPIEWERLKSAFLDRFFPLELREPKVLEFINLSQGNMSVREYALKLTQLSKYAPSIVADHRAKISKYVLSVFDMVVKECCTAMLVHDMDISRLMMSGGQGRSRFRQKFSGQDLIVLLSCCPIYFWPIARTWRLELHRFTGEEQLSLLLMGFRRLFVSSEFTINGGTRAKRKAEGGTVSANGFTMWVVVVGPVARKNGEWRWGFAHRSEAR
ncbi:hypothetical protein MTR67_007685 [Solanum verrucosum]|uniref:Retrotransposon gag domain-containing protein n=1 Tax=Solanum verrucosum TaxID=315347 RepID=A0AAF0Q2F8_SOLVR|nr:hypothetical protein MTR67_007685 [Solanum verrucosum]